MTTRTSSISIVATACDSAINRLTVQTHSWRNAIQRLYGHLRKHTLHLLQKRLSFTQGIHPYGLSSVIQSHNQQKDLFLAVDRNQRYGKTRILKNTHESYHLKDWTVSFSVLRMPQFSPTPRLAHFYCDETT